MTTTALSTPNRLLEVVNSFKFVPLEKGFVALSHVLANPFDRDLQCFRRMCIAVRHNDQDVSRFLFEIAARNEK